MDQLEEIALSIIIPCFNSFELMKKGLKHLENDKNNKNIEIIIVDDCSTDNSYDNLLKFQSETSMRINVIKNKTNMGPGESRNKGISKSNGKYITFLDSDDFFIEDFLDKVIPLLDGELDCIVFDFNIVDGKKNTKYSMIENQEITEGNVNTKDALVYVRGCTCGKIYKTDIIRNNNIKFLALKRNEDMPFTKCAISNCKSIYYYKKSFYNYVQQKNSLMHNKSLNDPRNAQQAFMYVKNNISNEFDEEKEAIFAYQYLYSTVLTKVDMTSRRDLKKYIDESEKIYSNYINNKYYENFPLHVKIILWLIKKRCWIGIKLVVFIKSTR